MCAGRSSATRRRTGADSAAGRRRAPRPRARDARSRCASTRSSSARRSSPSEDREDVRGLGQQPLDDLARDRCEYRAAATGSPVDAGRGTAPPRRRGRPTVVVARGPRHRARRARPPAASSISARSPPRPAPGRTRPSPPGPAWTDRVGTTTRRPATRRAAACSAARIDVLVVREQHDRLGGDSASIAATSSDGGRVHRLAALDARRAPRLCEEPPRCRRPRTTATTPHARRLRRQDPLLAVGGLDVHVLDVDLLDHADGGRERERPSGLVRVDVHLHRARRRRRRGASRRASPARARARPDRRASPSTKKLVQ